MLQHKARLYLKGHVCKNPSPLGRTARNLVLCCCRRSTLNEGPLGQGVKQIDCERLAGKLFCPVTLVSENVWICHVSFFMLKALDFIHVLLNLG